MRFALLLCLVPLLGLIECGPVTVPPNPDQFNSCAGKSSCASYCTKGEKCAVECAVTASGESACLQPATALPSFVLVVDIPEGAEYAPEQTFVLTSDGIALIQSAQKSDPSCNQTSSTPCCSPASRKADSTCVPLPLLVGIGEPFGTGPFSLTNAPPFTSGFYEASTDLGAVIGVDFGPSPTSLPAQFSLTPEWTVTGTTFKVPPALLGLPVPVVQGSIVSPFGEGAPMGPSQSHPVGWASFNFGVLPSGLAYAQALEVLPPFENVPPVVDTFLNTDPWEPGVTGNGSAGSAAPVGTLVCVDLPSILTVKSTPPVLEKPDGWTVFFREVVKQRVLSSIGALGTPLTGSPPAPACSGVSQDSFGANVYSFVLPDLQSATTESVPPVVVVSPPPGRVFPTLIETFQGLGTREAYPPMLPAPAKVSGNVVFETTRVAAELHFVATSVYEANKTGCDRLTSPQYLFYDVVVATDPKQVGEYSVMLPPGEYVVTINPDPSSGAPQAKATLKMPLGQCPAPAEGITNDFATGNAIGVTGTVMVPGVDGKKVPLPFATVDLTAALPSVTPMNPPTIPASPIDSPGSFEVLTDANGHFVFNPAYQANVGPGLYDLTIRPVDGTRFPWVVSQAQTIPAPNPFAITVPAPAPLTLTIHDPNDLPIVEALVRAYAFPPCSMPPCFAAARQIGEAFTDATGSFQMLLAPAPFVE